MAFFLPRRNRIRDHLPKPPLIGQGIPPPKLPPKPPPKDGAGAAKPAPKDGAGAAKLAPKDGAGAAKPAPNDGAAPKPAPNDGAGAAKPAPNEGAAPKPKHQHSKSEHRSLDQSPSSYLLRRKPNRHPQNIQKSRDQLWLSDFVAFVHDQ